jgi:hypothetical protein
MTVIAMTGPRQLTQAQRQVATQKLRELIDCSTWHVGDATGLDMLARSLGAQAGASLKVHQKNPILPYKAQGAERSTRMVQALAADGGTLHAWPNKPVPLGLKPSSNWPKGAGGSGTWGTIALAVGLGVPVVLHPLSDDAIAPTWLCHSQVRQLTLI